MTEKLKLFNQIYTNYNQLVMLLCLGFVNGDRVKAKDISQEVFINTWNSLDKFRKESSYKTWIYRITVNICLKSLRDTKSSKMISIDSVQRPDLFVESEPTTTNQESIFSALYTCIGQLPETDRLIIMMVLDNADYSQIADVMGITNANARVKVYRIKQTLKRKLQNEYAD